jgi:penicillin-binding protein 1C
VLRLMLGLGLLIGAWWFAATPGAPLQARWPLSRAVFADSGELLRLKPASDGRYRLWQSLAQYPPVLIELLLLKEDAQFYRHPGVNPWRLGAAAWASARGDRQGGSTLSMQLARLLDRRDTRSVSGKFGQVLAALNLERRYDKAALLEAYLNLAPFGGNIEGAATASLVYFGKQPSELTVGEALSLVVLPQRPTLDRSEASALSPAALAARTRLLDQWLERHPEHTIQRAALLAPPPLRTSAALPFRAPHLSQRLIADADARGDPVARITATIDLRLQTLIEQRVAAHLKRLRAHGVRNAAALLIDSRTMAVKAQVGSADFFDRAISGQIDGTRAKRSPGSTLKPFIYALGIDQGVIHPLSVLRDVPTAFGPFAPENFDGAFLGPVTATDALVRSRNVPAVAVAAQLSNPTLYGLLQAAQVSALKRESHYGLALVLGGGEISMVELSQLYAALSHDGQWRPIRTRQTDADAPGLPLFSAEAAFLTREMLKENPRPDLSPAPPRSAWKTGTSWGFRDAWSAGLVGPYVLVVWLGNFDNTPNPALVGVSAAAPLYFSIVDALKADGEPLAEPPRRWPLNLKRVEFCAASGALPNVWCRDRRVGWFVPGVSSIGLSTLHRPLWIDRQSGRAACGPTGAEQRVFEFWPSELARSFELAGLPRRPPPTAPHCAGTASISDPPRIVSPRRAVEYRLDAAHPSIPLNAHRDAAARTLYWFANGAFIGATAPGATLDWTPNRTGEITVSVRDDLGISDSRRVRIGAVR